MTSILKKASSLSNLNLNGHQMFFGGIVIVSTFIYLVPNQYHILTYYMFDPTKNVYFLALPDKKKSYQLIMLIAMWLANKLTQNHVMTYVFVIMRIYYGSMTNGIYCCWCCTFTVPPTLWFIFEPQIVKILLLSLCRY